MEPDYVISAHLLALKKSHLKRILRIVCSGGGAKGVVYPGACRAMEETGLLKTVNVLAGSSAGALTATLIAVGMPSAVLRTVLLATNLKELLGNGVGAIFGKNLPGVCFITKDGKPIEEFIRQHILETVRAALNCIDNREDIANQDPDFKELLNKFQDKQPRFTFADLATLHHLFPAKFKQLVIPAVKFPNGDIQIFNKDLTPNIEIALACRASASIPVILEPVEIEINGKKEKFVDGGFYDNLPMDYFDVDETGTFIKNKHPEQTLVFAFGRGLNDKKNSVFQALYGERWNEIINEEVIREVIIRAIKLPQDAVDMGCEMPLPEDTYGTFSHAVQLSLDDLVTHRQVMAEESQAIMGAVRRLIEDMSAKSDDNLLFLETYQQKMLGDDQIRLLVTLIKEKLRPNLCDPGILGAWKRNVLTGVLGDLKTPYKNTAREEIVYQKLRTDYPLRTVELRVGNITTLNFNDATKHARIMDAFGYLDTINHISNHQLYDEEKFDPSEFYIDLITYFELIYQAILCGATKGLMTDPLWQEITSLRRQLGILGKNNNVTCKQIYHVIKDRAEKNLDSAEAFALSRAVEFRNQNLSANELFEETYKEGFKRSYPLVISTMTRERFFKLQPLQDLRSKSMYQLYLHKNSQPQNTPTDKVFDALQNIKFFREEYERYLQAQEGLSISQILETAF